MRWWSHQILSAPCLSTYYPWASIWHCPLVAESNWLMLSIVTSPEAPIPPSPSTSHWLLYQHLGLLAQRYLASEATVCQQLCVYATKLNLPGCKLLLPFGLTFLVSIQQVPFMSLPQIPTETQKTLTDVCFQGLVHFHPINSQYFPTFLKWNLKHMLCPGTLLRPWHVRNIAGPCALGN